MTQSTTPPESVVAEASALEAAGRSRDAVTLLVAANRDGRRPEIEERLVDLRFRAALASDREPGTRSWPMSWADPHPGVAGLPEIEPGALTVDVVGGAILHHGALVVRGLLDAESVARIVADTDRAFEARERHSAGAPLGECAPDFVPFTPGRPYEHLPYQRQWVRNGGAVWLADSPPALWDVLDVYERVGLPDLLEQYLGTRPALSVNKTTLRRVPVESYPAWHQDGAFLGDGVRTVNVWVSLSHCGGASKLPALDVVARRIDAVLETGTEGAMLDKEVSPEVVAREAAGVGVSRPEFQPGDALIFDELFLHRTAISPGMEGCRYAIESWFFDPSCVPPDYPPLAV